MGFTAEFFDLAGNVWLPPAGIVVMPLQWSANALGGPERALIQVKGPSAALREFLRVLRFEVRIRNTNGRLVWWGYVHETSVTVDGSIDTLSLEDMYNSVRVLYSYEDDDGAPQDGETAAATSAESIARYGAKEMLYSLGEADAVSAEKLRDKFLALHAWPLSVDGGASAGGGEDGVILGCCGWWETLRWEYYADASGREVFDAQNGEITVGWRLISNELAFTGGENAIHHNGVALRSLRKGDQVKVSNSGSSDGIYTVEEAADESRQREYTATTIRFEADEVIADDGVSGRSGLGFLNKSDFLKVAGSTSGANDRYWRLNEAAADKVVIQKWWGYNVTTQGAGPSVTITRLLKVGLASGFAASEYPGATATLDVLGMRLAMKWTPSVGTWDLGEISLKVWKVGTPSDNLQVELCADSAGVPGTVLATATLAGSAIGKQAAWKKFTFGTPASVTASTHYHIVLSRTGANSSDHYYKAAVDEDLGYGGGSMVLWNGSGWIARAVDADLPFQAWGGRENATQMAAMLVSCGTVGGAEVATTGIVTRHYRDGRSTVLDEVTRLIEQGTSAGAALVANVTPARTVQVEVEPTYTPESALLVTGREIFFADGTRCEPGYLPVGRWAQRRDLPSGESYARASPLFLQQIEYNASSDAWQWTRRGVEDVFAKWSLRQ